MNTVETIFSVIATITEQEFSVRFPGPFFLQVRALLGLPEFDKNFDTSTNLKNRESSTKDLSVRLAPVEKLQGSSPDTFNTLDDLQQYCSLFSIEKTHRNTFSQGITIGRTNNNDIVVGDGTVSKFHAWIQKSHNNFTIFDAKSHYGTYIDGALVKDGGAILKPRSKVRIGNSILAFLDSKELFQWALAKHQAFKKK